MKTASHLFVTILAGSLAVSFLSSCSSDHSQPNVEVIQDMMESPAIKSQEYDEGSPNHSGMRIPPEGTQPIGFEPYRYATAPDQAANNKNPLAGDYSEETLKTGLKYYTIHCAVCHAPQGEGGDKMTVAQSMALKPPSLIAPKIVGWTDGQIYHVITMGQGVMGPYASHIPQKYRWQVVNYVRHLQGKGK